MELRPYQHSVIHALWAARGMKKLLVAPTGAGKTEIACGIIQDLADQTVLFLAHRRELIFSARDKLARWGIPAGVILAGEVSDPAQRVQIASIQTLWSRQKRDAGWLPSADVVFVDEAHHSPATTYRKLIEHYKESCIVGLTATPSRADGRGLGGIFDSMVECPQVPDLIDRGYLVKTKVYAPTTPDLKGVKVRMGDYHEGQLAARMDTPKLVGDIISHWHRLAGRKKTVVFASSVGHSIHLKEEFVKSGVRAEHIDGKTDSVERDRILKRLSDGDLELITNCMVLTEGWDQPDVGCLVLARPTKSMGLYRQMVGRAIRTFPGKDHALVLDHAGATFQHGFIEEPVTWTLDPDKRAVSQINEARKDRGEAASNLVACSNCDAIRTAGKPCPECGHMPKRPGDYHAVIDADLALLDINGQHQAAYSPEQRQAFYQQLLFIAHQRGYKSGWAGHKFKEKFGRWPSFERDLPPQPPSPEVASWVRHRQIAYAKAMQKASAA
jgi:DNA repair protein RadD